MEKQEHVSAALQRMRDELVRRRDIEIACAHEVGSQYITDHNDRDA